MAEFSASYPTKIIHFRPIQLCGLVFSDKFEYWNEISLQIFGFKKLLTIVLNINKTSYKLEIILNWVLSVLEGIFFVVPHNFTFSFNKCHLPKIIYY